MKFSKVAEFAQFLAPSLASLNCTIDGSFCAPSIIGMLFNKSAQLKWQTNNCLITTVQEMDTGIMEDGTHIIGRSLCKVPLTRWDHRHEWRHPAPSATFHWHPPPFSSQYYYQSQSSFPPPSRYSSGIVSSSSGIVSSISEAPYSPKRHASFDVGTSSKYTNSNLELFLSRDEASNTAQRHYSGSFNRYDDWDTAEGRVYIYKCTEKQCKMKFRLVDIVGLGYWRVDIHRYENSHCHIVQEDDTSARGIPQEFKDEITKMQSALTTMNRQPVTATEAVNAVRKLYLKDPRFQEMFLLANHQALQQKVKRL